MRRGLITPATKLARNKTEDQPSMPRGLVTNANKWVNRKLQGKTVFQGLPVSIENSRGSYRQGVDQNGKQWRTFMHANYGYVRSTLGVDGDHVDVYLGPVKHSTRVFIVHQNDPYTGKFDEDKVMLGYSSPVDAKQAYLRQYDRPDYFGSMDEVDMATFKKMLKAKKGMKLKKSRELTEDLSYTMPEMFKPDGSIFLDDTPVSYADALIKGNSAKTGTVHVWSTGPHRKMADGSWKPVASEKKSHKPSSRMAQVSKDSKAIIKSTGNAYEACIIRDSNGSVILKKDGEKNSISFSPLDISAIKNSKDFIHNHPNGFGFSKPDVILTVVQNVGTIWAVSDDRSFSYTPDMKKLNKLTAEYYDKRPWAKAPHESTKMGLIGQFTRMQYEKTNDEVYDERIDKVRSGDMSLEWADNHHATEVLDRLIKIIGGVQKEYHWEGDKLVETKGLKKSKSASAIAEDHLENHGLYVKGKTHVAINPKELAMGIKVEMEHTNKPAISRQIALDHLVEDKDYYTHLAEMEAKNEGNKPKKLGKAFKSEYDEDEEDDEDKEPVSEREQDFEREQKNEELKDARKSVRSPLDLLKAKRAMIGATSKDGKRKKVAEGKWVDVPKGGSGKNAMTPQEAFNTVKRGDIIKFPVESVSRFASSMSAGGVVANKTLIVTKVIPASKHQPDTIMLQSKNAKVGTGYFFLRVGSGGSRLQSDKRDFILTGNIDIVGQDKNTVDRPLLKAKPSKQDVKEITNYLSSSKLSKARSRANLVPIEKQVMRNGRVFTMRVWVSRDEANKVTERRKTVPMGKEKRQTFSRKKNDSTFLVDPESDIKYSPKGPRQVDRSLDLQYHQFKDAPGTGLDTWDILKTAETELKFIIEQEAKGEYYGRDWYSDVMVRARATLAKIHPELSNDEDWSILSAIIAITSPGANPSVNLEVALPLYEGYKENGVLPETQPDGTKWPGTDSETSIKTFNTYSAKLGGARELMEWMRQDSTGREIKSDVKPKATLKMNQLYPNSIVFGPKVGVFFRNLLGESEHLTIDRWAARSFYRWSNKLAPMWDSLGHAVVKVSLTEGEKDEMRYVLGTLANEYGMTMSEMQAVMWYYEKRLYKAMGSTSVSDSINYEEAANNAYERYINEKS